MIDLVLDHLAWRQIFILACGYLKGRPFEVTADILYNKSDPYLLNQEIYFSSIFPLLVVGKRLDLPPHSRAVNGIIWLRPIYSERTCRLLDPEGVHLLLPANIPLTAKTSTQKMIRFCYPNGFILCIGAFFVTWRISAVQDAFRAQEIRYRFLPCK